MTTQNNIDESSLLNQSFSVNSSFNVLKSLSKVKQREVPCPIIKQRAITTSLMTIDDLTLKTTIAAPDLYDLELTKLVYNHSSFPDNPTPLSLNSFMDNVSYIDRKALIWGIFASTYGTMGTIQITCPYCNNTFSNEIKAEELIHSDSLTVWDKEVPFNEYVLTFDYICNVEGLYKLEFDISLPSISQQLAVMKLLSADKLKDNFNKIGNVFSKPEEIASIVRMIKVYKTPDDIEPQRFLTTRDIHRVICQFMPMDVSDFILDKYNEEFDKFTPVFKKPFVCSQCNNDFNYVTDPEVSLFRQFFRTR